MSKPAPVSSSSGSKDTPASSKRQIVRSAGIITLFTLISRILGAVRDLVIAHVFGAGMITDAFIQAFTIPNVLRRLTAEGSMTLAFIPLYTELREKRDPVRAKQFAQQALGLVLWATVFLTALGMIFSPQMVLLVATGFREDPEKFALTVDLTRLMFPYLIFVSVVAWAMGVLNAEKRFAAPAAAPILLNIGIIGAAWWVSPQLEQPIVGIGWGVLLGGLMQVLLQVPALRKLPQSLWPKWPWHDPDIHRLLRLLGPSLFGVAVYQINIIVLRNIASFLPSGQVTYYYNANRLTELVLGLFAFAFTTASFPNLSEQTAKADWEEAVKTLRFTFTATLFIVLPATVGLIAAAEPIITMLYFHGQYTLVDVNKTIPTLQAFAVGIPAVASIRLLVALFYALQDTKTPVVVSFFSLLVTGGLGWWLSLSYEVVGLAWGLSGGTWFQFFLLVFFLRLQKGFPRGWWAWSNITKYALAAGMMGGAAWYGSQFGDWERGIALWKNWVVFISVISGSAGLYFAFLLLLRDSQALRWLRLIRRR